MQKALIVDDDEVIRDVLQSFLSKNGFEVSMAEDAHKGLELLREEKFDIVLTDLVMPGMGGMDILKEMSAMNMNLPVIVMTAFGTVQSAVEAMKLGAFDYITKPFILDELMLIINRAANVVKLQKENTMLKKQLKKKYNFKGLIGDSPNMVKVYEMIEKIADSDSTILITGESGTGKELIAKTIHFNSSRCQEPFVPLNCAAIPKDLLESELFGHEKGAFTGAFNMRAGRFELAHNGTLFLDEIGELAPSLQVKMLRVLQEREFERVGGVKTIKVDVRILAATNKDLEKEVREGRFREDLYYRLNVIPLHLPPLRERLEDIPLLMDHFVHEFSKKRKREPLRFSEEAVECLLKYRWPGNVRELENLIERLTILVSGDTVTTSDLPEKFNIVYSCKKSDRDAAKSVMDYGGQSVDIPEYGIDLNAVVDDVERKLILRAIEKSGGVKSMAATILGLNRTTLIEKMKKMGIKA
ncbi:MAG: sigma-54 dependent transcriptional regulator [Thermodesulfovibrionales bacterium]|nr:sigma-54 dependent transcriptional regulator [Thermodesulfovibrionales bacterium]